jgi:hypothetical protein
MDMVEIVEPGHVMRHDTWQRYQEHFPTVASRSRIFADRAIRAKRKRKQEQGLLNMRAARARRIAMLEANV